MYGGHYTGGSFASLGGGAFGPGLSRAGSFAGSRAGSFHAGAAGMHRGASFAGTGVVPMGSFAGGTMSSGYYGAGVGGDPCGCGPGDGCGPGTACGGATGCAAGGCGVGCGGNGGNILAVVGDGLGEYVATTTYRYVGMGAGNVGLVPIPGRGCSCWWSLCFLWLLLLPLLLLPSTTTTTTTTTTTFTTFSITVPPTTPGADTQPTPAPPAPTPAPPDLSPSPAPPAPIVTPWPTAAPMTPWPTAAPTTTPMPPQGPQGICKIFGDPHVKTFDGSHASFYSQGEYWIVKSSTVWIQGRYMPTPVTNGLSVTKEIAIGGPFLNGPDGKKNVLRISSLRATFNDKPIIPGFPDRWSNDKPKIEVIADSNGELMQASREGMEKHIVHVKLPLYIELQINRWNEAGEGDYINVKLTMSAQPQQDGHCGNFNGNPDDDSRPLIRSRIGTTGVAPENLLFHTKTPVAKANRPDLNNCPTEKTERAKEICKKKCSNGIASEECMVDVCFGGEHMAEMTDYDC